MDGEAVPNFSRHFCAVDISERLPAMDVEVVHYEVNGFGFRVCRRQLDGNLSELKGRTIRRGEGEMTTPFSALRRREHRPCRNVRIRYRVSLPVPVWPERRDGHQRAA